jgi:hypothetical protein
LFGKKDRRVSTNKDYLMKLRYVKRLYKEGKEDQEGVGSGQERTDE